MKQKDNYKGLKVLSFLFPIVGLIIYAINVKKDDELANIGAKWALIGVLAIPTIIFIVYFIIISLQTTTYLNVKNKKIPIVNEILSNQTIETVYNHEAYGIEMSQDTVNVILKGTQSNISLAKQVCNAYVDFSKLNVGTHNITVNYKCKINDIDYEITPKAITVKLCDKMSTLKNGKIEYVYGPPCKQ